MSILVLDVMTMTEIQIHVNQTEGAEEVRAMSDLISRQGAIDLIDHLLSQLCEGDNDNFIGGIIVGYHRIRVGIKYLPSADRKTGKWIAVHGRLGNEVKCDQCGSVFWYWLGNYRFCPSCGSKNIDERGVRNV